MPNYVLNRLEMKGELALLKKMLESIQNDELGPGSIDFDKIIPMPPAPPTPVLEKLAEQNPGIVLRHRWADKDIGYHCGEAVYAHGALASIFLPKLGRDSLDFISDFVPVTEEDYARFMEEENPTMTL